MMNFMKMRTFYKKLPLFIKKTPFCILIKNSNLKYELYKKTPFLELLETPASHNIQAHHIELLKIKIILPGLNIAEEQREEHGKSQGGRREVKQGEVAG